MKKVVVKIGGSLAIDEAKLADFVAAVSKLPAMGCQVAVVHGGGKDINENISLLREQPTFIDGLRVTTEDGRNDALGSRQQEARANAPRKQLQRRRSERRRCQVVRSCKKAGQGGSWSRG